MGPGRSLCVRRPRGVGGLGRERTGTGDATHRVMLVLFHLVYMNKVSGILSSIGNFGILLLLFFLAKFIYIKQSLAWRLRINPQFVLSLFFCLFF